MDIVIKCQHLMVACSLATLVLEGTRGKGNDELYSKGNVIGSLFQLMPITFDDGHYCLSWSVFNYPLFLSLSEAMVLLLPITKPETELNLL